MGGDFNMALYAAEGELRKAGLDATFLGSYAWLKSDIRGGGPGDTLGRCRFDSLGLFAVVPVSTVSRLLNPSFLRSGQK